VDNLKIITMAEVETESVSWLWKPYIPFGKITIVQGDPGEGKTTLMLAIAAAITNGEALPMSARRRVIKATSISITTSL